MDAVLADDGHLGPGGDGEQHLLVAGHCHGVGDPERPIPSDVAGGPSLPQISQQVGLALAGSGLQGRHGHLAALGPCWGPGCGLETEQIRRLRKKSLYVGLPEEFAPDITVVADACFYPVRNCGKIIDVGHGMISKGYFYKDSPIVRRENLADVICVPGQWHKRILEKNVFVPIRVSGFLKTDTLYHFSEIKRKEFLMK